MSSAVRALLKAWKLTGVRTDFYAAPHVMFRLFRTYVTQALRYLGARPSNLALDAALLVDRDNDERGEMEQVFRASPGTLPAFSEIIDRAAVRISGELLPKVLLERFRAGVTTVKSWTSVGAHGFGPLIALNWAYYRALPAPLPGRALETTLGRFQNIGTTRIILMGKDLGTITSEGIQLVMDGGLGFGNDILHRVYANPAVVTGRAAVEFHSCAMRETSSQRQTYVGAGSPINVATVRVVVLPQADPQREWDTFRIVSVRTLGTLRRCTIAPPRVLRYSYLKASRSPKNLLNTMGSGSKLLHLAVLFLSSRVLPTLSTIESWQVAKKFFFIFIFMIFIYE